ncbi:serine/threonine-protein kinase [Streptomyces sp.]|uniref:serine/threonine-protein kinase n=1 Tax=Streptomyces sp. TaxID=1931 RepID=UPI002D782AE8|nr:serine/threonine-protein kinase [Streptomyces sp.]HET6355821.1 serine/threonine-protein kinase [Streptomyces sp.]
MSDRGRLIAGRYRLYERIGRGGMGTVWRAGDELLGREVAVKKLHVPHHLQDDELATLYERTRREARSAARINHPNVVVVHDVLEDEGLPCIVMEYVRSRTLGEVIKKDGPVSPLEAARVGRGMIAALRAAHRAGVLHRDVKPANVLLGLERDEGDDPGRPGGRVVLTDFGIAVASGTSTLTRTGELIGSFDYLAPERLRGGGPGPASDLWALGATLYQALEGVAPFHRDTPIETAYAIAAEPYQPPRRAGALTPVIEGLLEKDPERRMTAEQVERLLSGAVDTVLAAAPVVPRTASAEGRATRPPRSPEATTAVGRVHTGSHRTSGGRRRRTLMWAAAGILVVALAGGGVSLWPGSPDSADRSTATHQPPTSADRSTATHQPSTTDQKQNKPVKRQLVGTQKLVGGFTAKIYKLGQNLYQADMYAKAPDTGKVIKYDTLETTELKSAYGQHNVFHFVLHPDGTMTSWSEAPPGFGDL